MRINTKSSLSLRSSTDAARQTISAVGDRLLNDHLTFIFDHFRILVSLLCVICVLGVSTSAQDWKKVHDGVDYAQTTHNIGSDPVKINLLRLDLDKVRLDVYHAFDKPIGVEPTSAIAKRHGGVAAINAGFFRLDKSEFAGDSSGILMIDGELWSESLNDRATLILSNLKNKTQTFFGHYQTETWIRLAKNDQPIPISGIHRERKNGEAIIYHGNLEHRSRLQTGDVELWLSSCNPRKATRMSDRYLDCKRIVTVDGDTDSTKLRPAEFIVSVSGEFVKRNLSGRSLRELIKRGHAFEIGSRMRDGTNYFAFTSSVDVTNGVPQLIKNGTIDITWQREKASKSFVEMRHPRTAVAKLRDGKFLLMTVDGRQPGVSVGMSLQELAEYLLSIGATDAMNLDGGGSTTMFLDGKIVNTPSDREGERKVSDAIVVTLRKNARRSL